MSDNVIYLTPAQLLTIVSELGGKQTTQVRIRHARNDETQVEGAVIVTYDAGWGTLTLRVFADGSSSQAGLGVTT